LSLVFSSRGYGEYCGNILFLRVESITNALLQVISSTKFDHEHHPKRVFLSEDKNDNVLACIISKVKIIYVDPNVSALVPNI
jgi:hypothetical protein